MTTDDESQNRDPPFSESGASDAQYTRPATWDDVKLLARYLADAGVEYALIGSYAIAAHGYNRFSEDIDVLVDPSRENTRRWIDALSRLPDGACRELSGKDDIFERSECRAVRVNDVFTVDLVPGACGHTWSVLKPHIETRSVDDTEIRVLSLEGLLLTKEGTRDKDRADARVIRAALEQVSRRS